MEKIEHLGIAVANLDEADGIYERLLGVPPYKRETVESERVVTSFFRIGPNKVELLQALDPESVIARFVARHGEGLHHVAFAVTDIRSEMQRLRQAGFTLLSDEPRIGADNKWVCFVHPRNCHGVLIELCQERD